MDYKKIYFFPGMEFTENLYVGFKEDLFITYQKIIKTLKEKDYKIEKVGFKFDTSFIFMEAVKNKKLKKSLKKSLVNLKINI